MKQKVREHTEYTTVRISIRLSSVSEMTSTVSSGTLNPNIPYHSKIFLKRLYVLDSFFIHLGVCFATFIPIFSVSIPWITELKTNIFQTWVVADPYRITSLLS